MSCAFPPLKTSNKNAKIPNTNFTVQFVIDQLDCAGTNCPKIWQLYGQNLDANFILECLSGTGFLSSITRITFFFNNSKQQFSIIMKVPTTKIIRRRCQHFDHEEMGRIGTMIGIYHSIELAFYTQIVPKYLRHVPKLGELIAQIYAHSDTFILMEDLTPKGGEHRTGVIDQSDVKMVDSVVEAMALLHSHSLAIPKEILENLFQPRNTLKTDQLSNAEVQRRICSMPAPMGQHFSKHLEKLAKFLEATKSGPEIEMEIARQLGIDLPVLCHGDLWLNNLLFDPNDGKIKGILDWQFAHFGNGISDIAHFLLNAVDADLRRRFTGHWLNLYHDTFIKHINGWASLDRADSKLIAIKPERRKPGSDHCQSEAEPDQCLPTSDLNDCRGANLVHADADLSNWAFFHDQSAFPANFGRCLTSAKSDHMRAYNAYQWQAACDVDQNDRCQMPANCSYPCHQNVPISLQQVHALYSAVFPCHLHSEISIEALLHGENKTDAAECGRSFGFSKLIWQRICAAFDELKF